MLIWDGSKGSGPRACPISRWKARADLQYPESKGGRVVEEEALGLHSHHLIDCSCHLFGLSSLPICHPPKELEVTYMVSPTSFLFPQQIGKVHETEQGSHTQVSFHGHVGL